MPNAQDEAFVRLAVALGHLTEEQGAEALAALAEIEALGASGSADEVLTKRGALSEGQAEQIRKALAAQRKLPRQLGGFELREQIGRGGMGSVFKATQRDLDRVVAVKVLKPRLARNQQFVAQFLREARSAGRLSHPNIVAAIDVGESEGFYYFAMEYVAGETLAQVLQREGRLAEDRAIAIAVEVARALDHAAQRGLIHRDIKPENIMLTPDGRVRVTDFGLAKAVDPDAQDKSPGADRFLGTPAYMAPEQVRSEPSIDGRADIFSLGVTLFQMLTGQRPFQGANTVATAAAVLAAPLPSIRKLRPEASMAVCRVIEKMTAKEPAERYATAGEVIRALKGAAAAPRRRPRVSAALGRRARGRRRSPPVGAYIGAAIAILVLLILLAVLAARLREEPRGSGLSAPGNTRARGGRPPASFDRGRLWR